MIDWKPDIQIQESIGLKISQLLRRITSFLFMNSFFRFYFYLTFYKPFAKKCETYGLGLTSKTDVVFYKFVYVFRH